MSKYSVLIALLISAPLFAKIEVQGHRGARAVLPENTLAGFNYALQIGVDTLELDLSVTKDDVLIVAHDQLIDPEICLNPKGQKISKEIPFRSLSLKEVKEYDCGSLKNPRFPNQTPQPGEQIPTLDEVFELVKNSKYPAAKKVLFNIETKSIPAAIYRSPSPKKFADLILKTVKKHGMLERVWIQSFDHRTLYEVKKINKKAKISLLLSENFVNAPALIEASSAEVLSPNMYWITPESVKKVQKTGARVIPWTANTPKEWAMLIKAKVDGIITDDPLALIEYLKKKGLR